MEDYNNNMYGNNMNQGNMNQGNMNMNSAPMNNGGFNNGFSNGFNQPMPPVKKKHTGLIIGLIVGVVVLAIAVVVTLYFIGKNVEDNNYTKGTVEDNVYKSEFLGIKIECPDGYSLSDSLWNEEMADKLNQSEDMVDMANSLTEVAMTNDTTNTNLQLIIANNGGISEEEAAKQMLKGMVSTYETAGYTYESSDISEETLAGEKYKYIETTINVSGVEAKQEVYVRNKGSYTIAIAISYANLFADELTEIKNSISQY